MMKEAQNANREPRAASHELKYVVVLDALKADVLGGKYSAERKFPSETQLMRRFGCSRITVVRALQELRNMGLIVRRKGCGSFVSKSARERRRGIGIIIPTSRGEIFPPICHEITRLAQTDGYSMALADLHALEPSRRVADARKIAEGFVEQNLIGVVFHLMDGVDDAKEVNAAVLSVFAAAGLPVVLTDCDCEPHPRRSKWDVVGADDVDAGYRLARHLVSAGARRVVFCSPKWGGVSFDNRARGCVAALEEAKLRPLVVNGRCDDVAFVRNLLRSARPDAVVCGNDRMAAAMLGSLAKLGKRVPADVMLAGFDDVNYARLTVPRLTTMRQPCAEIGRAAYETLLARIREPSASPRKVVLTAPLVVRESTGGSGKVE